MKDVRENNTNLCLYAQVPVGGAELDTLKEYGKLNVINNYVSKLIIVVILTKEQKILHGRRRETTFLMKK